MQLKSIFALGFLSLSSAVCSGDTVPGPIDGAWVPASAELAGQPDMDDVRSLKLVIKGNQYTVTVGPVVDAGTLKLDPAASPKSIDISGTDGPNKGKTFLAIYERAGDTLRICYDLSGKSRPVEFKTLPGTQLFLVTYKSEKP